MIGVGLQQLPNGQVGFGTRKTPHSCGIISEGWVHYLTICRLHVLQDQVNAEDAASDGNTLRDVAPKKPAARVPVVEMHESLERFGDRNTTVNPQRRLRFRGCEGRHPSLQWEDRHVVE